MPADNGATTALQSSPGGAGKAQAIALVADFTGERLCAPLTFAMNRAGITGMVSPVMAATANCDVKVVRCGVEASGYHRPLLTPRLLPDAWTMLELNPAHIAMQRRVNGQRSVKTDLVDATAMFDLLVTGRGHVVGRADTAIVELAGWVHLRRSRVALKRAIGNHLISQMDRAFPGVSSCFCHLLGTRAGRLVIDEFTDPARLARMGVSRFQTFARTRGVRVSANNAEKLVEAARQALPAADS